MNNIMQVRAEVRLKEWADQIAECQSSGQTIREWCREHDIAPKTYYYRLRKVRERAMKDMAIMDPGAAAAQCSDNIDFRPLEISGPSHSGNAAVTLHISNATMEIAGGCDRATIEAVLLALKSTC